MVSLARVLRDYREAGSLNGLIGLWGFGGSMVIFLSFFIVVNLVVDLAVLALDPRIRKQAV